MRKIILAAGISLDGYIARPDGSIDFLFMPKGYSMGPFFKTIDTALMGRKTYEVALRMSGGKYPSYGLRTYVFSRSRAPGERDGVIFTNDSARKIVESLRKREGKHIFHMGGGELAREFLKQDLIDEVHLGVVPVLLGEGIPLFPTGFPQRNFDLIENKTYPQGLVTLKYARVAAKSKGKTESKK
jgi:dihydrofolate reductase